MDALDKYLELQQAIYDYFGYKEDWVAIPMEDRRDMTWQITNGEGHGGQVSHWKPGEKDFYVNSIYTQRFLPKWVYRGEEYTMICVDTHSDGNKFLAIYTNKLEVTASTGGVGVRAIMDDNP